MSKSCFPKKFYKKDILFPCEVLKLLKNAKYFKRRLFEVFQRKCVTFRQKEWILVFTFFVSSLVGFVCKKKLEFINRKTWHNFFSLITIFEYSTWNFCIFLCFFNISYYEIPKKSVLWIAMFRVIKIRCLVGFVCKNFVKNWWNLWKKRRFYHFDW